MSRVGKQPISVPKGVDVTIADKRITVKGSKGNLSLNLHTYVDVRQDGGSIRLVPVKEDIAHWAMCGTMRALVNNMVIGVSQGFEKRLQLIGVGYRAQAQGPAANNNMLSGNPYV